MKMHAIARSGSLGNRKLLSKYGGSPGSGPSGRQHYAKGGAIKAAPKAFAGGGEVDGNAAPKRLDRPGRKMAKDGKKKGTNINVVVMAGKGDQPQGGPPMPPPGPMAGPPPMPPRPMPMPPPGGPMGPGGPPMGLHKHGGKVKAFKKGGRVGGDVDSERVKGPYDKDAKGGTVCRAKGGRVKKAAGGDPEAATDDDMDRYQRMYKSNTYEAPSSLDLVRQGWAREGIGPNPPRPPGDLGTRKHGGKIHKFMKRATGGKVSMGAQKGDEVKGKPSMASMKGDGVKAPAMGEQKESKGTVKMEAGAGGGLGRLEKMKEYGKAKGGKC